MGRYPSGQVCHELLSAMAFMGGAAGIMFSRYVVIGVPLIMVGVAVALISLSEKIGSEARRRWTVFALVGALTVPAPWQDSRPIGSPPRVARADDDRGQDIG